METTFLSLQPVPSSNAEGIITAMKRRLADINMDPETYNKKLVACGTDGASVNTGRLNGVVATLRRDGRPHLLGMWCVAHKLELAVLDCLKENRQLADTKEMLQGLYKQVKYSPKAKRELLEIASALEEKVLMPSNILGPRWTPHLRRALQNLLTRNFKAVVMYYDHVAAAESSSPTMIGRSRKSSAQLKDFGFVLFMHFMLDILEEVSILSLKFQATEANLEKVCDALSLFTVQVEGMRHAQPRHTQEFLTATAGPELAFHEVSLKCTGDRASVIDGFTETKSKIINDVLQYMSERFGFLESDTVLNASRIFNPLSWPANLPPQFGVEQIEQLADHFENVLGEDFNLETCLRQWEMVKVAARRFPKKLADFWYRVHLEYADDCKLILRLSEIVLVLPLNTAVCERAFSIMKKVKCDWRASMDPAQVSMLMRIEIEGCNFRDLDNEMLQAAVQKWYIAGERAKRPMLND